MNNILGISGSPRKNGNTDRMIHTALTKAVQTTTCRTDFVRLYDIAIKPCLGCNSCQKNGGKCVIKDDMPQLLDKIKKSDILVLGTPVYWWAPSAGFKTFMDRWYSPEFGNVLSGKKVVIVIPLEDTNEKTALQTYDILKNSLNYLGASIVDIIISAGTAHPGDVDKKAKVIENIKLAMTKAIA